MIATTGHYQDQSTVELRRLVRDRGLAQGAAVASARKEDLIAVLEGSGSLPESPLLASAAPIAAAPIAAAPIAAAPSGDLADIIAQAISGKVKAGLDEDCVRVLVDERIESLVPGLIQEHAPTPTVHQIIMPERAEPITLDGQAVHRQLPQVLAWLRADVPVWLWGAPGAGKTHLARQLAECLGVKPYVMSIDETTTANKLLGFQNLVSGEFVKGWLYEPYKNGGLVTVDEIDTGNPGVMAGLNALIANGHYMFPNGETVERHKDFRVIAAANTNGTGAVAGFTARQRLDAATLNRFAVVKFEYDEALELLLACGLKSDAPTWEPGKPADSAACLAWVRWVHRVREIVGQNVLISPRASLLGTNALRAGIPADEVAESLIFALCTSDTKDTITRRAGQPGSAE